jgi:hypothetical protein
MRVSKYTSELVSRRALLLAVTAVSAPSRSKALDVAPLLSRFDTTSLSPLSESVPSAAGDLRYPAWLAGTWRVENTAAGFSMPLGSRFVNPYVIRIAEKEVSTAKKEQYLLRYVDGAVPPEGQPSLMVRQARPFNTIQEERASGAARGSKVERGTFACNAAHPHGRILLDVLDEQTDGVESSGGSWEALRVFRHQMELDIGWAAWESAVSTTTTGSSSVFVTSELAVQRALLPSRPIDESFLEILMR